MREPMPIEHPWVIHEAAYLSGYLGFRYFTTIVFFTFEMSYFVTLPVRKMDCLDFKDESPLCLPLSPM